METIPKRKHCRQGIRCCRGFWVGLVFALIGSGILGAGCMATAECDEYVGCSEGEVCFQRQCRARCEENDDCEAREDCEPCLAEGESGEGRCLGEAAMVCVERANE